jgi:hypothetical protein
MDASPCQDVQTGLVGRPRHGTSSSLRFRELPPPEPDRNHEQIPGCH